MRNNKNHYLPDFCEAEVVLKLILMVEFAAIVFSILTLNDFSQIYRRMGLTSLFMLFVVIASVSTLCFLNSKGVLNGHIRTTAITLFTFSFFTVAITFWIFSQSWFIALFQLGQDNLWFVIVKFGLIALICVAIGLRYLFVQYESKRQLMIHNKARLQALQARIRPHFLFNSMNTIASLVHDAPTQAEQATVNLSHLFRASLSEENLIPLAQEIQLTKDYIDLEHLRLSDRLKVEWVCESIDQTLMIPPLTLQPLVENAIYHGIEPMVDGGLITISLRLAGDKQEYLRLTVSNPVDDSLQKKQGNQMALNNIKERLDIAFKGRSSIDIRTETGSYMIEIQLPVKL